MDQVNKWPDGVWYKPFHNLCFIMAFVYYRVLSPYWQEELRNDFSVFELIATTTSCLPFKELEIPLCTVTKDTASKHIGFFSAECQAGKLRIPLLKCFGCTRLGNRILDYHVHSWRSNTLVTLVNKFLPNFLIRDISKLFQMNFSRWFRNSAQFFYGTTLFQDIWFSLIYLFDIIWE